MFASVTQRKKGPRIEHYNGVSGHPGPGSGPPKGALTATKFIQLAAILLLSQNEDHTFSPSLKRLERLDPAVGNVNSFWWFWVDIYYSQRPYHYTELRTTPTNRIRTAKSPYIIAIIHLATIAPLKDKV
jgi:hypothetical protein